MPGHGDEWCLLEWNGDDAFALRNGPLVRGDVEAEMIREKLLAVKTPEDGLELHWSTGLFFEQVTWHHATPMVVLTFRQLCFWRDTVKRLMVSPQSTWLSEWADIEREILGFLTEISNPLHRKPAMELTLDARGVPGALVRASSGLDAVIFQTYIEKYCGVEFRACARPDCPRVFPVESNHGKTYCGGCAHVVAQRDYRERKRKNASPAT